ncbi:hypothetical protein SLEP1_g18700 [Rubroshorea leprosula]|uniref:Uncharacterized protein n=1 Tax=Rubroshorea leprosula TaxID=152421 RepID=A0AAV5J1W6_9ROSI|nr:hypothetical protein SLEP1_g18700 [Rubroshorea leprosula]
MIKKKTKKKELRSGFPFSLPLSCFPSSSLENFAFMFPSLHPASFC